MIPSPQNLPPKFTAISSGYKVKVSLAILSIALFFTLFFSLVALSFWVLYWAIIYPMYDINKFTILLKLGSIAGSVMLVVFVLKFLWKMRNQTPENRVEVSEKDEPELWKFILDICRETGAPKPKSIYLDPDVNAYVRYTNSSLSLIMPVGKELTIGLPLLHGLNQSEFKAVMSHEFGHFAQRSMRIGSYVGTSNTIIHDMIFSNDSWDRLMIRWRQSDIRIAIFGWILWGIVYLLRLLLRSFYFLLNVLQASLSREMEFNADKFAVSTTGSIPIISGLWKLEPLNEAWNTWLNNAYHAKSKEIYTHNLFERLSMQWEQTLPALLEDESQLEADSKGGKLYFRTSAVSKGHLYDSHPPHDQREVSAKTPFIACEITLEPAWKLISQLEKWQTKLTRLVYRQYWLAKLPAEINEEDFSYFVKEEQGVNALLKSYQDTFAQRYFMIPELEHLQKEMSEVEEVDPFSFDRLREELNPLMEKVRNIESKMEHAQHIFRGTAKVASLDYDGKTFTKKNISEVFDQLFKKREEYFQSEFADWDKKLCVALGANAMKYDQTDRYIQRLDQHNRLVNLLKLAIDLKQFTLTQLNALQQIQEVDITDINRFQRNVNSKIPGLNDALQVIVDSPYCSLPTIDDAIALVNLVVPGATYNELPAKPFEDGKFDIFMQKLEESILQLNRIEQRSLAAILMFERLNDQQ